MTINLAGPTTAVTAGSLTLATYTFSPDLNMDGRSRPYVVSAIGGTQSGVSVNTIDKPKIMNFRRPAQFRSPSGFVASANRFNTVPRNTFKVNGKYGVNVTANQVELMTINLDINIPSGAGAQDRANVDAALLSFITGLYDQKEEIILACYDGQW